MKALRQERGLSQDDMARVFGFKDRQTVSAIETGVRRVAATELLLAADRLNVPLDYFTDPFRLDGRGTILVAAERRRAVGACRLRENGRPLGPGRIGRSAPRLASSRR